MKKTKETRGCIVLSQEESIRMVGKWTAVAIGVVALVMQPKKAY